MKIDLRNYPRGQQDLILMQEPRLFPPRSHGASLSLFQKMGLVNSTWVPAADLRGSWWCHTSKEVSPASGSWMTRRSKAASGHEAGQDGEAWMGPVSRGEVPQSICVCLCSGAGDVLKLSSVVACCFGCLVLGFALDLKDLMFCTIMSFTSNIGCF